MIVQPVPALVPMLVLPVSTWPANTSVYVWQPVLNPTSHLNSLEPNAQIGSVSSVGVGEPLTTVNPSHSPLSAIVRWLRLWSGGSHGEPSPWQTFQRKVVFVPSN
ncbi:MAG: hypothetical protein AB7N53_06325 [Candidatus Binatia bacterium]